MNSQSGERTLNPSLMDHYAALLDVNLIQFVSNYSMYRGELRKRPLPVIVRGIYICGKTIHSAVQLPVRTSYRDLQGSSLH